MIRAPMPPEPEPGSLDESVNWMTYSHQEMYKMVHGGLDLTGATAVSADWARLGEALGEIGDELGRIGQEFAQAWQGDAADQAVHAVAALAGWAGDAGALATEVSGCITVELDNAMRARNAMPAPVSGPPWPQPAPIPIDKPAGTTLAASAFTGGDFGQAPQLLADQNAIVGQQHEAHKQAAETMEQFQTESREVYHTVPAFSAPKIGMAPPGSSENPPAPQPTPRPQPTAPQQAPVEPVPVSGPAISGPVAGGGPPVAGKAPVAGPAPAPGPVAAPGLPGQQPGADPARPGAPAAASEGASASPKSGGSQMGGMPMGGMGGGRKEEDRERKSPAYLKEDEDVWGLGDQVVGPPVIGEDQGRRA